MDQSSPSFPLTGEQFDKLMHYIEIRIAASRTAVHASRAAQAEQHLNDMKAGVRLALVGPANS